MGIFGKSEAELKKWAKELEQKAEENGKNEVNNNILKQKLEAKEKALNEAQENFNKLQEEGYSKIEKEKAELESDREEWFKLKAEAENKYAGAQRSAFEDVIKKQFDELDKRKKILDSLEKKIEKKLEDVAAREKKVAEREDEAAKLKLSETEDFAAKKLVFEEKISSLSDTLNAQLNDLSRRATELVQEKDGLEKAKSEWLKEEAQKRNNLEIELAEEKAKLLAKIEKEISEIRKLRLSAISDAENEERDRIRKEIAQEKQSWEIEYNSQLDNLKEIQAENAKTKGELLAKEQALNIKESLIENKEAELARIVEDLVSERKDSFEKKEKELNAEISRLRDSLKIQSELVGAFDQLKRQLGDKDPVEMLNDLNAKSDEIRKLRDELAARPPKETGERIASLEKEKISLQNHISELGREIQDNKDKLDNADIIKRRNDTLEDDNKFLKQKAETWEYAANEAHAELKRLRSAYERPAEVAARYKEIEMPYIPADKIKKPNYGEKEEIEWLDNISKACDDYGIHFPKRILKAFHTSLKTADWAPLTVLAGVSGTGKSELPRLYSHFGGLIFEPLSVQPNWDSQESMLGFFNSIDNKFDAQPVLRLLAQSQQKFGESYEKRLVRWQKIAGTALNIDPAKQKELIDALKESEYPGLNDCMCMVLLDEMNLAHPELYFAEFLSKLETRRGKKNSELPSLFVKIGAGLPPYQLPLGRNVLWTGTMNQDETTKSLSDKVLDRSIIINFPRPIELKRRTELKPLNDENRGDILDKKIWDRWIVRTAFEETLIAPYKEFVEDINKSLGNAGRAIGHRVWQSIEYYMANYPDVRSAKEKEDEASLKKAMRTAFEDQLVQKVMPKLRGIDTRGTSKTKCLDEIRDKLTNGLKGDGQPFSIIDDFNQACDFGHGQFMWQSANYLNSEDEFYQNGAQEEPNPNTPEEANQRKTPKRKSNRSQE